MTAVTVLVCQHEGSFLTAEYDSYGWKLMIDKREIGIECQADQHCSYHNEHIDDLAAHQYAEDSYCFECPRKESYCNYGYLLPSGPFDIEPENPREAQRYICEALKNEGERAYSTPSIATLLEKEWSVWTLEDNTYLEASYLLHKQDVVEVEKAWRQWVYNKNIFVAAPDKHFLKFCETWMKNRRS